MSTGPLARRVVITGMGMVSPLGRGTELAWRRLLSGASGLSRLPEDLAPDVPGQVAGQVPDLARDPEGGWDIDAVVSPKDQRKMDRFIPLALDASDQALAQAGWQPASEQERTRTACIIGSGIGGFGAIAQAVRTTDSRGCRACRPSLYRLSWSISRPGMCRYAMGSRARWVRRSLPAQPACRPWATACA